MLIQGFAKIFVPLALGSLAGLLVAEVSVARRIGFWRVDPLRRVPVMAGGVGEGAIPLSVGYAEALGVDHGGMLGQILPLVFFGTSSPSSSAAPEHAGQAPP